MRLSWEGTGRKHILGRDLQSQSNPKWCSAKLQSGSEQERDSVLEGVRWDSRPGKRLGYGGRAGLCVGRLSARRGGRGAVGPAPGNVEI